MDPERLSEAKESKGKGVEGRPTVPAGRAWHVYILLCRDGAYYVGVTNDLPRRWDEHSTGRGGHYTKCNPPIRLLFSEPHPSRAVAEGREKQLKGWTRRKKQALIEGDMTLLKSL